MVDNKKKMEIISTDRQTDRQTGRNLFLDAYKGILIVLVVIRHVLQNSVTDEGGILTNYIWAIQMPGFMIVAGFFSVKEVESFSKCIRRIQRSFIHYMLPFFAWFYLINVLLLGNFSRDFLQASKAIILRVDNGLWFLWVIFFLSAISNIANLIHSTLKGKRRYTTILLFYLAYFVEASSVCVGK